MFKSMKRIIKWAGKYKGRLYLGSVFSFFSSLSTAIPTMAAAYALDKAIAAYWAGNTIESSLIWQLGLFHDNVFNQFNLACDLMEPFRPIVDMKVKKMGFSFFEKEQKYEMISLLKEEVIIGNRNEYLTNAIKIYTKSVFDALNDNDVSQIKFYRTNEL